MKLFSCAMKNAPGFKEMKNNTDTHRAFFNEVLRLASLDYRMRHAWIARQSGRGSPSHEPKSEIGLSYCADKYGMMHLKAYKVRLPHVVCYSVNFHLLVC